MTEPTTADSRGLYVVVSGTPDDGREALARALAPALGLPLMAQASAEQALGRSLQPGGGADNPQLVAAATAVVLAMAADSHGGVLDGVVDLSSTGAAAGATMGTLPGTLVEVAYTAGSQKRTRHWPVVQVSPAGVIDLEVVVDQITAAARAAEAAGGAVQEQFVVWRQDESGITTEVTRRDSKEIAQKVSDMMQASTTRQTYWVTAAQ